MNTQIRSLLLTTTLLAGAGAALAQATIDQNKALAGNVTPGDAAGFPVDINVPGHYVLKSNLNVPVGATAISINVPGVTLDLNGFVVIGPNTCTQDAATAVVSCSQPTNLMTPAISASGGSIVRNGFVRGFAGTGLRMAKDFGSSRVERVHVSQMGGYGIAGDMLDVTDSVAEFSVYGGIRAASGRVNGSRAWHNGNGTAVIAGLIEGCSVAFNLGPAFEGSVRGTVIRANKGGIGGVSLGGNFNIDAHSAF